MSKHLSNEPAHEPTGRTARHAEVRHPLMEPSLAGTDWRNPRTSAPTTEVPLRIAILGGGGAGKTTVAAALARTLAALGRRVLVLDADPLGDLAAQLPLDACHAQASLQDAATRADALAEGLPPAALEAGNTRLAGTLTWGGGNPFLLLGRDVTIVDTEAGLGPLSRDRIADTDLALIVVAPHQGSIADAFAMRPLASLAGARFVHALICGYQGRAELLRARCWLSDWPPVAAFPFAAQIRDADPRVGAPPLEGELLAAVETLAANILELAANIREAARP